MSSIFGGKPLFQAIIKQIEKICLVNKIDDSHGLAHALKIATLTQQALASDPAEIDGRTYEDIICAALLHDMDDHKYFMSEKYDNAYQVLRKVELQEPRVENVVNMIRQVSFSKNGNNISNEVPMNCYLPHYVDRIEAIGMLGLVRCYHYSKHRCYPNQPVISIATTPRPQTMDQLLENAQGRDHLYMQRGGTSDSVIDHFFDKLVHIALPPQITNPFLNQLYEEKQNEMRNFILRHSHNGYEDYLKELMEWESSMSAQ